MGRDDLYALLHTLRDLAEVVNAEPPGLSDGWAVEGWTVGSAAPPPLPSTAAAAASPANPAFHGFDAGAFDAGAFDPVVDEPASEEPADADALPLPARLRLTRITEALAVAGLAPYSALLAAPRFTDGAEALARLGARGGVARAVDAVPTDDEAGRLATALVHAAAALGGVALAPATGIVGPSAVWVTDHPRACAWSVAVDGLEPGWSCVWDDDGLRRSTERTIGPEPGKLTLAVRVTGRAGGEREVLRDILDVEVRRVNLRVRPDRLGFVLVDDQGIPGGGVDVRVGDWALRTDASGAVALAAPIGAGAILVDGVSAGVFPFPADGSGDAR